MINMDIKHKILEKFKRNKGFICSDEINTSAEKYHIQKMLNSGEIQRLKRGVYIREAEKYYDERVLLSKIYPQSVFCLFSAWEYYELSTSIPTRHYLAFSRKTKVSLIDYPPVQMHYWDENSFNLGISEIMIDNNKVRFYDIEKSVCDAVKNRGKVGEDIAIEVIKNYIRSKSRNLDKLMKYSQILKTDRTIQQFIKPLL